jgi:hypothetical protein
MGIHQKQASHGYSPRSKSKAHFRCMPELFAIIVLNESSKLASCPRHGSGFALVCFLGPTSLDCLRSLLSDPWCLARPLSAIRSCWEHVDCSFLSRLELLVSTRTNKVPERAGAPSADAVDCTCLILKGSLGLCITQLFIAISCSRNNNLDRVECIRANAAFPFSLMPAHCPSAFSLLSDLCMHDTQFSTAKARLLSAGGAQALLLAAPAHVFVATKSVMAVQPVTFWFLALGHSWKSV